MLKKFKHQFIAATLLTTLLIISLIIGSINFFNFKSMISNADNLLSYLQTSKGDFTDYEPEWNFESEDGFDLGITTEMPYETRYFSVSFTPDNKIIATNVDNIAAVDKKEAEQIGRKLLQSENDQGFYFNYRYLKTTSENGTILTFLDCTRSLNHAFTFLLWSLVISILSLVAILFVLILISDKVARPFVEAYEKQRQFISNAGHDIKTPLTIINADAELLELEFGESEWIKDIKKQSERMTALTTELIYLTKIDVNADLKIINFPFSDIVEEAVKSFSAVAATKNITIDSTIPQRVTCKGDENSIRKLVNLLFDNATKYTPSGETITVSLKTIGKNVHFKISNPAKELSDEMTKRIFDRFYRSDKARSSGGFGIGLSVASAIVSANKGKIFAKKDGDNLVIEVVL